MMMMADQPSKTFEADVRPRTLPIRARLENPKVHIEEPVEKVDDGEMTKDEEARLLREMLEGSSDDDSDEADPVSDGQEEENSAEPKKNKDDDSVGSIESDDALFNKSLGSDDDVAVEPMNYLRYASEKENMKQDLIEIVDKNEISFKQVAEKMIE